MKVVVTHWIHQEVAEYLETFSDVHRPTQPGQIWTRAQVLDIAGDADALVTSMADFVDDAYLKCCPKLKIISATLKGYDNYDADACARHGVWLAIVPDSIIAPTAEQALALTLSLLRNVRLGDEHVRSGSFVGWRPHLYGKSLSGTSVGVVGMGQLGLGITKLLDVFGISQLLYTNQADRSDELKTLSTRSKWVNLSTLFKESEVIIVALPLTESTYHIIDHAILETLKNRSYFINIGRGSVVNEEAILTALKSGRLAGYAADVFEMEDWALPSRPQAVSAELRQHPRTAFTPHLGSAVDDVRKKMSLTAAMQVWQALHGETPEHAVNKPVPKPVTY